MFWRHSAWCQSRLGSKRARVVYVLVAPQLGVSSVKTAKLLNHFNDQVVFFTGKATELPQLVYIEIGPAFCSYAEFWLLLIVFLCSLLTIEKPIKQSWLQGPAQSELQSGNNKSQSKGGIVVRALASHQCGPCGHQWVEFVVGSLLCSERFFSRYSGFPLSSKTQHFQIPIRSGHS